MRAILQVLKQYKNCLIVVLTPIVLLPLVLMNQSQEALCGYVMLMMTVFWLSEALPIPVTALMPVYMFPLFGILSTDEVAGLYIKTLTLRIIGAMGIAIAMEESHVHERIALKVLLLIGSSPERLMLGLMLTTWFLSLWMSNTACAVMVLSVAYALIDEIEENMKRSSKKNDATDKRTSSSRQVEEDCNSHDIELRSITETVNVEASVVDKKEEADVEDESIATTVRLLNKIFSLSVLYGATTGGIASLTGMGYHMITVGYLETMYEEQGKKSPLTFLTWLGFGVPTSLIILFTGWILLNAFYLKCRGRCCVRNDKEGEKQVTSILKEQYAALGPIRFAEVAAVMHLVALIVLWMTADIDMGWARFFKPKYIKDAVSAILLLSVLFVFPSELPSLSGGRSGMLTGHVKPLLTWEQFKKKIPWGILFLIGGGFALAKAAQESGLSTSIANQLDSLMSLKPWIINLILCAFVSSVTEFTSNTSTLSLLLPIISEMSVNLGFEPWYLLFSCHFSTGFTFMLPISTISTATIFSYGRLKILDMVKTGIIMNIVAVMVLVGNNQWLGKLIFSEQNI